MFTYCLARKHLVLQPLAWLSAAKPSTTSLRPPQKPPSPRRWLAGHALRLLLAVLGTAFATSCADQEAILLMIRPPAGVTLAEYEVKIQDRTQEPRQLIYQSGIQPVAARYAAWRISIEKKFQRLAQSERGRHRFGSRWGLTHLALARPSASDQYPCGGSKR